MGTDGEKASLVSEHNSYTEETGKDDKMSPPPVETINEPTNILGQFHEDALVQVGMGKYHCYVGLVAGLCFMIDGIEVFVEPYLAYSIQNAGCLDDFKMSWLHAATMLGMVFGSIACSFGDHIGRKIIIVFAFYMNIIVLFFSVIYVTFPELLCIKFINAFVTGLCLPMASVYFYEFLPKKFKGKMSLLLLFWAMGGFLVLAGVHYLLPMSGDQVVLSARDNPQSWKSLILLTKIPTIFGLFLVCCAPESVRYLLDKGKDVRAISIYQKMHKKRSSQHNVEYQLTELELPSKVKTQQSKSSIKQDEGTTRKTKIIRKKGVPESNCLDKISEGFRGQQPVCNQLCSEKIILPLIALSLFWGFLGLGFYGYNGYIHMTIQNIKDANYFAQVKNVSNELELGKVYNYGLQNQIFENVTFEGCVFSSTISHVLFKNCTFNLSDFTGILSSKTYFVDSVIENARIYDTDFTEDRFNNTQMINVTFYTVKKPCRRDVDFRVKHSDRIYENMLVLIAIFIAYILQSLCLFDYSKADIAVFSLLITMVVGAITEPFISNQNENALLFMSFLWNISFMICLGSAIIITIKSFPAHLRATCFGISFAAFRLSGLLSLYVLDHPIPLISIIMGVGLSAMSFVRMQKLNYM